MVRHVFIWLHRWTGLAMAGFLIVVGVTGSLLAFKSELEHLISPHLFATPRPGVAPLDLATLAERAGPLVPQGQVASVTFAEPDQVRVGFSPRKDPATGKPYDLGFNQFFVDPWTGEELGRRRHGDISQGSINLIPFIYTLHYALALGMPGIWVLGIVALVWTLDCFVGFYLTLPVSSNAFWRRWESAWLIKRPARAFRLNFDLHRASGLWLWPILLIFAWSSVYMNLWDAVYTWATLAVLEYKAHWSELAPLPQPLENPRLDFRSALATGERLMAEQATSHGFSVRRPVSLSFDSTDGVYHYTVRSSRDIEDRDKDAFFGGRTELYFDARSGVLRLLLLPTGQYSGNTVTTWLYHLHMANVFGLPWRIFVCVLGLAITMLSVTGIYIWWKKRRARKLSALHRGGGAAAAESVAAE
ncbi:MAG: PepSY-associated TM helix domain-containing protein [Candidatus Binataceae bacterium]